MNLKFRVAIILSFLLSSCAPKMVVVRERTPESPSFTVIPAIVIPANIIGAFRVFDPARDEMAFAAEVESEIVRLGLKVVERPPFKFLETTAPGEEAGRERISGDKAGERKSTTIDVVAMYPDATSDYIVVTYFDSKRVRIIRKQDKTLVATLQVDTGPEYLPDQIYSAFAAAGFVKNGFDETRCKKTPRKVTVR